MADSGLLNELRVMAPEDGWSIVCAGRTTRQMNAAIRKAAELIESLQAEVEEAKLNGEAWERRSGADYERAEQAEAQVKSLADALRWVQSQSHIETRQGMLKVVSEALSKLEASNVR